MDENAPRAEPRSELEPESPFEPQPDPPGEARRARPPFVLHMPVNVRNASLAVLAVLASLWALKAASEVFIPILLAMTFSYALSPVVDRLERWRWPRALSAALLLTALVVGIGWTGYTLSDDATALVESLPTAAQKLREAVRPQRGHTESTIDKVQRAASQLEQAAQEGAASPAPTPRGVTRVTIERSRFDIKDYLWSGTLGVMASVGQAVVVLFITFFLLAAGSTFRRKLVKITGPSFAQKRITVQVLDEITAQIRVYLLVQLGTSVLVGLVTGLAFWAIGLERAAVWGVAAFVLNFVPYIGSIIIAVAAALMAFVQFSNPQTVLLVAGTVMLVHTISGNLLTPWLTSRTNRMNPIVVFIGVLGFGWLWGAWGLLLGVPVLTSIKAVCDRVDDLKPIGELMGA